MRWLALHVYYHSEQNRLLRRFVAPLVAELGRRERIDRFFFIRFGLGGPHLRLRFRIPADPAPWEAELLDAVTAFVREHPSPRSLPAESIRRSTHALAERDPQEDDLAIYPDNSARFAPFLPETERYGGAGLLSPSLDFFTRSSAWVLELIARQDESADSLPLSAALQLLVRQALGFSRSCEELVSLLGYSLPKHGEVPEPIERRVQQVLSSQKQALLPWLRREIELPGYSGEEPADIAESRRFARAIREAPSPVRRRILVSQQHMTANRLGLRNVDELYLCSLLQNLSLELAREAGEIWSRLDGRLGELGS